MFKKKLSEDVRGVSAIKEILLLVITDVIAVALIPTIATGVSDAQGNLTDNASASGMVALVVIFYVIVILVVNVVVVINMLGGKKA